MQEELTNLLFGEENIKEGNITSSLVIEGDREEMEDYNSEDYDLYSYQDKMSSRRISEEEEPSELPIPVSFRLQ